VSNIKELTVTPLKNQRWRIFQQKIQQLNFPYKKYMLSYLNYIN